MPLRSPGVQLVQKCAPQDLGWLPRPVPCCRARYRAAGPAAPGTEPPGLPLRAAGPAAPGAEPPGLPLRVPGLPRPVPGGRAGRATGGARQRGNPSILTGNGLRRGAGKGRPPSPGLGRPGSSTP